MRFDPRLLLEVPVLPEVEGGWPRRHEPVTSRGSAPLVAAQRDPGGRTKSQQSDAEPDRFEKRRAASFACYHRPESDQ